MIDMDYERIGEFIKNLRKEKGLAQKELAKKLGVTDKAVSKWERGLGCPDVSLLNDLSKILDVQILELLKGTKIEPNKLTDDINNSVIETINYSRLSSKDAKKM